MIENASTGRTERQALIALDPLETLAIDTNASLLETIRAAFQRYRGVIAGPPGYGIICVFAYDAAFAMHGISVKPRANRLFGDVLVIVPGTWLWFDPAGDSLTLAGISRSASERAIVAKRLDGYAARLAHATQNKHQLSRAQPCRQGLSSVEASLSRRGFLARVAQAKRAILRGDAYQLVVGIRFSAPYDGDALDLYERLASRNPSPCGFLIERGQRALLGASPEFLVRSCRRHAELRPLAGTRPRGASAREDAIRGVELLNDPKEIAEHAMLVDLGRNDLSRVCRVGSVRVERAMALEKYSHVMHIASSLSGELADGRDALDLFAATFPAGTVTGTPKRRAMELIAELEPIPRDVYAGSVARFGFDGSLDAALTLRSVALCEGQAVWQAGAGVVHRSDPESEYAEVLAKTRIVRVVLGIEPNAA